MNWSSALTICILYFYIFLYQILRAYDLQNNGIFIERHVSYYYVL